jgi:hypothetical protein
MRSTSTRVALGIALAVVLAVAIAVAGLWNDVGKSEISLGGWLAMGAGIILTLALGIGLMALVFFSSRRGYDEGQRGDR